MKQWLQRWAISIICSIVIVVTALISAWQWTRNTSDGTVHVGKPQIPAAEAVPAAPTPIDTAYFTTTLPSGFVVKRMTEAPEAVAMLQLAANDKHQQFAVTIRLMPAEGLPGIGDYNLRATQTASYEPYRPAGMPVEATAFRAISGTPEITAFWPHGALVAEVSMSSDGIATTPELFTTFVQATHTWQWR